MAFIGLSAVALGCRGTEPGEVRNAAVQWMEWPAEISVGQPYQARFVFVPICSHGRLDVREVRAHTAVAFEARWVEVRPSEWGCEPAGPINFFATRDAGGLDGPSRTVSVAGSTREGPPLRFGDLRVVGGTPRDTIRAAGYARFWTRANGCSYMLPGGASAGLPPGPQTYQFAGTPPDTSSFSRSWVEGWIEQATTSCGTGEIFHLTN